MNTYFHLDAHKQQTENIYFMESTISLEDNIMDFSKFDERQLELFEIANV